MDRFLPDWPHDDIKWIISVFVLVLCLLLVSYSGEDEVTTSITEEPDTFMMLANDGVMYSYSWETLAKSMLKERSDSTNQMNNLAKQQATLNQDKMQIAQVYEQRATAQADANAKLLREQKAYYEQMIFELQTAIERLNEQQATSNKEHQENLVYVVQSKDQELKALRFQFELAIKQMNK